MSTKALDGMTPFEALTGNKPDLRGFREWGYRVWVRNEKTVKLGGRVDEGVWVGFDEQSKGCQVYWPKKQTVTVERNVYFDGPKVPPDHLEGEDFEIIEAPTATSNSTHDAKQPHHHPTKNETSTHKESPADIQEHPASREKRIHKPSQWIQDIIDGRSVTSAERPSPGSRYSDTYHTTNCGEDGA